MEGSWDRTAPPHSRAHDLTIQLTEVPVRRIVGFGLILAVCVEACRNSNAQEVRAPATQSQDTRAPGAQVPAQPAESTARFVSHVDHVQPGGVARPRGMLLRNPYE